MQTFMPYPSIIASAKVLDYRRLGKQRVEAYQIMRVLRGESEGKGWTNHPATSIWRGYEGALAIYGNIMCREWKHRGYKDSLQEKFQDYILVYENFDSPPIIGNPAFHLSHQSNLIRKDAEYYRPIFGADIPDDLPYVWAVDLQESI